MKFRLYFPLALLPTVLSAAWVQAETVKPAVESVELDTVTVHGFRNAARYSYTADAQQTQTATKTAANAATTPQSVSVVTRRHLDEREPQDIAETLAYTSGASGGYRGENTVIEMSVRGIGGKSDGGGQPTFIDGLRYAPSLEINPYVLDRAEIVKGPASVLYGQANPGGLVNLSFKEATGSDENEVILKTGSGHRLEAGVDSDRRLNDQTAYRLVAAAKRVDWQAGKETRQQAFTLAPSLRWQPSEKTELVLKGFYEYQPKAGDRNFLLRQGTVDAVDGQYVGRRFFASDPNYHDLHNRKAQIGYRFHHDFTPNLSLHQNVRYGRYRDYLKSLIVWDPVENSSEMIRRARIFDEEWRDFQADTRLQWKVQTGGLQHDISGGIDYEHRRNHLQSSLGGAPSIDWRQPVYGIRVDDPSLLTDEQTRIRQTGLYLQDQMAWDGWHVLLGGRYDTVSRKYHESLSQSRQNQTNHHFTWRTGALYRFGNGLSPYISYSTSFIPETGQAEDGSVLKPTTAAQYEAGIKYQPRPEILMTASAFNIRQKNLTVTDPQTYGRTQQGKVRTRGAEIEIQGDITPAWGVSGSYTYLDKTVREDAQPLNIGTTPWGIPRHSASLWSDYRFSGALGGLSAGIGLRRQSRTWGDNTDTFRVPSFTVWDMKLGYRLGSALPALKGTTVQLNVQNLFNKQYVASCSNNYSCFYGKGRVVTLSAGYRW